MAYDKEELFKLTIQEKLSLVEDLLNSIEDAHISDNSRETFEKELDRRAKCMDDFPESLIPWEKVKEKMK